MEIPFSEKRRHVTDFAALITGTVMAQRLATNRTFVTNAQELSSATNNKNVNDIIVSADIANLPSLRLLPGQTLRSSPDRHVVLSFRTDVDGLEVTTDNSIIDLDIRVTPTHHAIWNDRTVIVWGRL